MTNPLVSVAELAGRLAEVVVFDLRWSLADPSQGKAAYLDGHIPGAVFVDVDGDLSAPDGDGRHPLPAAAKFTRTLGMLGAGPGDEIVVYDELGGSIAARMWWMLRSIGHEESRLLDGGIGAWIASDLPVTADLPGRPPATYPEGSSFSGVAGIDDLAGRHLIDARSPERYRGEIEPVDPKAGHIPGAINMPTTGNLTAAGTFLPARQLAKRYQETPDDAIVSCGSGVTACHAALAIVLAGHPMPDVYIGSFSDWSRRDLPVVTGDRP